MTANLDLYRAAHEGVGWLDRSDRVRVVIAGPDRAKFLHNLTTNEVKRLKPGQGCEAFVTTLQGKTLGYVSLLAGEDHILLRTESVGLESLFPHLQKYGLFDDVTLEDDSGRLFEFHVFGPNAGALFKRLGVEPPAEAEWAHQPAAIGGRQLRIVRESPTGRPGFSLIGGVEDAALIAEALLSAGKSSGLATVDGSTFEAMRIEAGTPMFGLDVTPDNLPQEIDRDRRAISFVKGCYLGQETVARIDALGHVNKRLRGLRVESDSVPPAGSILESEGQRVGTVTSSAYSPGWGGAVLLAMVKRSHAAEGAPMVLVAGDERWEAVVSDLPMLPPA